MTFNIDNTQPQPIYTAWTDIQGAEEEKVEETLTPEEIKAIQDAIKALDQEIDDLLTAAAEILKNGSGIDSPEFKLIYDKIAAKYQERADKQIELNKATDGADDDTSVYPDSIISEIFNKLDDPDLVDKLKEEMKDQIDELNRAWAKIRDAIVSAIIASMSGGSANKSSSNSDSTTKNSTSVGPIDLYTEIKTQETDKTEETKEGNVEENTGTDNNVEGTETPKELSESQTTPDTHSPTTT